MALAPRGVVFGSEIQQVVRHPAIRAEPNEAMIAEYLTGNPETVTETLWSGVERLAPAHALEITADGARARRYWDFDPGARIRYARDEEYAEHFREIFLRAVECRVRDEDAVGVMLSGGIDSSAIAGAAQAMSMANGSGAAARVHARISWPAVRRDRLQPGRDREVGVEGDVRRCAAAVAVRSSPACSAVC